MKTITKITASLAAATVLFVGCGDTATTETAPAPKAEKKVAGTITEESLGLRKTNLYAEDAETEGDVTRYGSKAATTSTTIQRAFQDAPPMIPHDVTDYLPITLKTNACIDCHSPETAPSMNALPYPSSHMTNFRATTAIAANGKISKNGKTVDNTSDHAGISIKKESKLINARWNCSQCHAPQSDATDAPANTFQADFTSADGASKSSWSGTKLMKGIDTVNGK